MNELASFSGLSLCCSLSSLVGWVSLTSMFSFSHLVSCHSFLLLLLHWNDTFLRHHLCGCEPQQPSEVESGEVPEEDFPSFSNGFACRFSSLASLRPASEDSWPPRLS